MSNAAPQFHLAPEARPHEEPDVDALAMFLADARWPLKAYPAGASLFVEGAPATALVYVRAGVVRCFRLTDDGRRHVSRFAVAGDVLGLGVRGAHRFSAEAVTGVRAGLAPISAVFAAGARDPAVRAAIDARIADEFAGCERTQLRLSRLTAEERIADFVLEWLERVTPDAGIASLIPMSRLDIADHLGLTLETVSRGLNRLHRLGLITMPDPHHLCARRPAVLERLARGDRDVAIGR